MSRTVVLLCVLALTQSGCGDDSHGDGGTDAASEAGAPQVELGTGDLMYEALLEGQTVGLVMGCQGGFHVWTAVRARGLNPASPILDLTMTRVRDGMPVSMLFHVRSTLTQEGSTDWYDGYAYRLQVNAAADVLGEDVEIRAMVTDRSGLVASDVRRVHVIDGGSACSADGGLPDADGAVPRDPDAALPGDPDAATPDGAADDATTSSDASVGTD